MQLIFYLPIENTTGVRLSGGALRWRHSRTRWLSMRAVSSVSPLASARRGLGCNVCSKACQRAADRKRYCKVK